MGLLGFGATSHVYEVVEGGQQVTSSIVCSVEVLSKLLLFLTIAISLGTKPACVMVANLLVGVINMSARTSDSACCKVFCHKYSEDALTRWVCAGIGIVCKTVHGEVHSVCRDLPIVQELTHNGGAFLTVCAWVARLLPFPPQNLLRECAVLQSLQGIAGIPNLVHDQCMDDSIFMRLVLDPMAPGAFSAYNLHNTLPSLVQMLKARAMFYA